MTDRNPNTPPHRWAHLSNDPVLPPSEEHDNDEAKALEQPTTEAGRDLLALDRNSDGMRAAILAIEAEARAAERRAVIPSANDLTDIIEQAIFETDTGLEAALLATERILDAVEPGE
jgi:hypothetical protein